jgi:hypothetical protein
MYSRREEHKFVRRRTAGPADVPFCGSFELNTSTLSRVRLSSAVPVAVPVTGLAVEGGGAFLAAW